MIKTQIFLEPEFRKVLGVKFSLVVTHFVPYDFRGGIFVNRIWQNPNYVQKSDTSGSSQPTEFATSIYFKIWDVFFDILG